MAGGFGAAGGEIFGALGGRGPTYQGYSPKKGNLRRYESYQSKDINQLRGIQTDRKGRPIKGAAPVSPYEDPTLGYSPSTLQTMKGLSQGDNTAEKQNIYDAYTRSGIGTRGRSYLSAEQGAERGQNETGQRVAAGIAVQNEGQKRSDMAFRMGQTSSAYEQGTSVYDAYANAKYQSDMNRFQEGKNRYAAVGKAAGSVMDAYTMGMM